MRREAYDLKRTEIKTPTSYSSIANRPAAQSSPLLNQNLCVVTPDIQKNIFACLMHAHIINAEKPGSFQDTINKVFPGNNLPAIIIPEDPPSKNIINQ